MSTIVILVENDVDSNVVCTCDDAVQLKWIKDMDDVGDQCELRRNELAHGHELQHPGRVPGLLRVMREAGGCVTLPVGELDSQDGPHEDRAVAERRAGGCQLVQEAPYDGVAGHCPRDLEIPLYCDPHEVHVIPREPVVHDIGADDLH